MKHRLVFLAVFAGMLALRAAAAPGSLHHHPVQPRSGEPVVITVPATLFTPGTTQLALHVQVVNPGQYIRRTDPAYTNDWRQFQLRDDGQASDSNANDTVFTAVLPGDLQQHRRLIRYFVSAVASNGMAVRWPAATNENPNGAYFVYDGLPAWTGASKPGQSAELAFSADFMRTMPAYHLLAQEQDVEQSQWDGNANRKRFHGTFVYEGRVYDHIQFHNRGKASTHVTGKNKWGFKFNAAEPLSERDLWGSLKKQPVRSLSLTACASPWVQINRGMAGMDEAVSFRAYQLAGVPAASTHWIQLRIIDRGKEAPATDQYAGDLWGLYQVIEEPGGEWLREHGWPDGDIYTPESGLKYRAQGSPDDHKAYESFMKGPPARDAEQWWRTNLNLPAYYTFHALNRLLSNVDLRPGANHYLYRHPTNGWTVVPWDLDMMFIPKTHQPGFVDQARCLEVPALKREYQNRAREVLDLFCSESSTNGGQVGQLVAELAQFIAPAAHQRTWAELDASMWNWHPRSHTRGAFYNSPATDQRFGGEWTRTLKTKDFAGFCNYIVQFCTDSRAGANYAVNDGNPVGYGFGYLALEARDDKIPARPGILSATQQRDAGSSKMRVTLTPFAPSPKSTNSAFAAVQWRIGKIAAPGIPGWVPGQPWRYEIEEHWRSETTNTPTATEALPLDSCAQGDTYRLRARYKDNTGRWSHWSEPVQFTAK